MVAAVNLTCVLLYITTEIYSKSLMGFKAEVRSDMIIKNAEVESEIKQMNRNVSFIEEFGNWWNRKLSELKIVERKINLLNSRCSLNLIILGFALVLLLLEIFFNTSFTYNEYILYPRHFALITICISTILHGITLRYCSITTLTKLENEKDEEKEAVIDSAIESIQEIGVVQSLLTLFSRMV
jgi:hypothetical protein